VGVATLTSTDNIDGELTLDLNQNDSVTLQTNDDNTSWNIIGVNPNQIFAVGTRMIFQQTAAPTGWTKDTTDVNNRALRVVSGDVVNGGDTSFTTVFSATRVTTTASNHTHSSGTLTT
jgi:hypothetical protein